VKYIYWNKNKDENNKYENISRLAGLWVELWSRFDINKDLIIPSYQPFVAISSVMQVKHFAIKLNAKTFFDEISKNDIEISDNYKKNTANMMSEVSLFYKVNLSKYTNKRFNLPIYFWPNISFDSASTNKNKVTFWFKLRLFEL